MEKHKRISDTLVSENLERVMSLASPSLISDGQQWYWEAHEFAIKIAQKYGMEDWKVSGIIAALSPMKEWTLNKRIAEEFILGKRDIHFGLQVEKAERILQLGEDEIEKVDGILNGRKTVSFHHNIHEPENEDYVTVDTHLLDALIFPGANISPFRYGMIENTIKNYSKRVNFVPCATQAIVWVTHKKFKKAS